MEGKVLNVLNIFLRPGKLQVEKRSISLRNYIDIKKVKWFIKDQMPNNVDVVYFHLYEYQNVIDTIQIVNIIKDTINKEIEVYVYNPDEIPDGYDFAWNKHCDDICYKMLSFIH